jgi:hypothetical protein
MTARHTLLERQARRIRWQTGLPAHSARLIAGLAYGGCR